MGGKKKRKKVWHLSLHSDSLFCVWYQQVIFDIYHQYSYQNEADKKQTMKKEKKTPLDMSTIREGNKWKDELESEEKSTLKDS